MIHTVPPIASTHWAPSVNPSANVNTTTPYTTTMPRRRTTRDRSHQQSRLIVTDFRLRFVCEPGFKALLGLSADHERTLNWSLAEPVSMIEYDSEEKLVRSNEYVHVCKRDSGAVITNVPKRFVRPAADESEEEPSDSEPEHIPVEYHIGDTVRVSNHNVPGLPWRPSGVAIVTRVHNEFADIRYVIGRRRETNLPVTLFSSLPTNEEPEPIDVSIVQVPAIPVLAPSDNTNLLSLVQAVTPVPDTTVFTEQQGECIRLLLDDERLCPEAVIEMSLEPINDIAIIDASVVRLRGQTPITFVRTVLRQSSRHLRAFVVLFSNLHFTCMHVDFHLRRVTYYDLNGNEDQIVERLAEHYPDMKDAFNAQGYMFSVEPPANQQTGLECAPLVVMRYYHLFRGHHMDVRGTDARMLCLRHFAAKNCGGPVVLHVPATLPPQTPVATPEPEPVATQTLPPQTPVATPEPQTLQPQTPVATPEPVVSTPSRQSSRKRQKPDTYVPFDGTGTPHGSPTYGTPGPTGTVKRKRLPRADEKGFKPPRRTKP